MPGQASVMKRFLGRMINAERTVLVHLSDRPQIQNPYSSMDLQVGQEYGNDCFHWSPCSSLHTSECWYTDLHSAKTVPSGSCRQLEGPAGPDHRTNNTMTPTNIHIQRFLFRRQWFDCPSKHVIRLLAGSMWWLPGNMALLVNAQRGHEARQPDKWACGSRPGFISTHTAWLHTVVHICTIMLRLNSHIAPIPAPKVNARGLPFQCKQPPANFTHFLHGPITRKHCNLL